MNFFDRALEFIGLQRVSEAGRKLPPRPPAAKNETAVVGDSPFLNRQRNTELLRAVADSVDVIRAAINAKKRHVQALNYDVVGPDDEVAAGLKRLLAHPVPGMTWRQWLSQILEDVLVLDAGAAYVWRNRGGELYGFLPIDGATIVPITAGITPRPPAPAYQQYIYGGVHAELTSDELLYALMNPRTNSRYGFSPVEAVLHTASIALRRMDGFADEMDDSNVPAFFGEVPEGWTADQIGDWQDYWDAMTENRPHRGIWGPAGADVKFPPRFETRTDFDLWLAQLTLAIFEVQPQELGLTMDVNRATGDVQEEITLRRSVRPMAMLVAEMIDTGFDVTGYGEYHLRFPELEERSREEIRADAAAFIPLGVLTQNEIREELGKDPVPDGDIPMPDKEREAQMGVGVALGRAWGVQRARPKRNFDVTPEAPDDNRILLALQDTLRDTVVDAGRRVDMDDLLAQIQEILAGAESLDAEGFEEIAALLAEAHATELLRIIPELAEMSQEGVRVGAAAFTAAVNIELDWTLSNAAAARWAREYGYELIGGLENTTRERIAAEMGAWVEAQEDFRDLRQRLAALVEDRARAELIASTEATRVYAEGNRTAWRQASEELGATFMQVWNTAQDDLVCPICGPLNGKTAPLDGEFDGGIEAPPAHPRCRCWLTSKVYFPAERALTRRTPITETQLFALMMRDGIHATDYSVEAPLACGCVGHTHRDGVGHTHGGSDGFV
jgi:SPP1 gp7 family putative phage head morphogenesis protein